MNCIPTNVHGAFIIEPPQFVDERGFFSPVFDTKRFEAHGLCSSFTRMNCSLSIKQGTLRGMHYQTAPYLEVKLLRVIHGAVWDVALDIRAKSPTFGQWCGVELTAENRKLLYIPAGCAHGFQTLVPNTEVIYLCSSEYSASHECGMMWNDPAFNIEWPHKPTIISDKDQKHPLFSS
jgi:dTDP-4-dehydrorhamnose 3,5-epimerase